MIKIKGKMSIFTRMQRSLKRKERTNCSEKRIKKKKNKEMKIKGKNLSLKNNSMIVELINPNKIYKRKKKNQIVNGRMKME